MRRLMLVLLILGLFGGLGGAVLKPCAMAQSFPVPPSPQGCRVITILGPHGPQPCTQCCDGAGNCYLTC